MKYSGASKLSTVEPQSEVRLSLGVKYGGALECSTVEPRSEIL